MADLWHLTLTSGHGRRSPRSEVDDTAVAHLVPLVRRARTKPQGIGGGVVLSRGDASAFMLGMEGRPAALRCTLCIDEATHGAYWRLALERYSANPVQTAAGALVEPSVPWLAVEMLPGAIEYDPDELAMLADAERCIAWAIIEGET